LPGNDSAHGNLTPRPAVEHPAAGQIRWTWQETITPEPYVPNLKTLREKIDKDRELLTALDPESDAYTRLQARITDDTTKLLDYQAVLNQRQDNVAAAEEEARRARAA
jgi:hypothetical protein